VFNSISHIFKIEELRRKIFITLALLIVYRAGCHIPTAGIDTAALANYFDKLMKGQGIGILGMMNLFTGGALTRFSIFALGIMPYISASIIMQLLTAVVPALERLAKEGRAGYEKINQYTRYFTFILCGVQGMILSFWLSNPAHFDGTVMVLNPGPMFTIITILTLTAGTIFIMWLGEQIQERGIGNGISIIIMTSIISRIPSSLRQLWILWSPFNVAKRLIATPIVIMLIVIFFLMIMAVVLFSQAQRRIPIQYGRRIVGRRVYGGQSTYLPIKVDMAGVIAIIFASSVISFPVTIGAVMRGDNWFSNFFREFSRQTNPWYNLILVALIMFFMYFYTAMVFNPLEISNNLKKYGGFVPGIRPGRPTANYLDFVASRIVFVGALYIGFIAIFPNIIMGVFRINAPGLTALFGGTTLLIMVGVILDTMRQIEGQLLIRHYDGFIKGSTLKGRK